MLTTNLLFAAGSLFTLTSGLPLPAHFRQRDQPKAVLAERGIDAYAIFGGDGGLAAGWPKQSRWLSFDSMFQANKKIMSISCTQFGVPNNSEAEISDIASAIQTVSQETGVDARFILAIVMQESKGCVRAPTTNGGVVNPGLMQSHNGIGSCNNGAVQNPCPSATITQMIRDGTAGTPYGDGLQQLLAKAGSGVSGYYKAARMYNSGSIDGSGNLGMGIATHCYSSDVANRLLGWVSATTRCEEHGIGAVSASETAAGGETSETVPEPVKTTPEPVKTKPEPVKVEEPKSTIPTPTPTPTPVVAPVVPPVVAPVVPPVVAPVVPPVTTPEPVKTPELIKTPPTNVGAVIPEPVAQAPATAPSQFQWVGAAAGCKKFDLVKPGDICDSFSERNGINFDTLKSLNAGLDTICSNLWLGYNYCVSA